MIVKAIKIIILLISLFLLYKLFSSYDFTALAALTLREIAMLLFISISMFFIQIFCLKVLFSSLLPNSPSFWDAALVFASGNMVVFSSATIFGSITQAYACKRVLKISTKRAIFVMGIEIFIKYSFRLVFCFIGAAILFWDKLSKFTTHIAVGVVVVICFALVLRKMFSSPFKKRYLAKISSYYIVIKEALLKINKKKMFLVIVLYSLIALLHVLIFCRIMSNFGYSRNIFVILCVLSVGFMAGVISLIPMGIGPKDLTSVGLLMFIGIDKNSAISCVLLDRVFFTLSYLILSIIIVNIFSQKYFSLFNKKEQNN